MANNGTCINVTNILNTTVDTEKSLSYNIDILVTFSIYYIVDATLFQIFKSKLK